MENIDKMFELENNKSFKGLKSIISDSSYLKEKININLIIKKKEFKKDLGKALNSCIDITNLDDNNFLSYDQFNQHILSIIEKEEEKRINFEYEFEEDFEERFQEKKDLMRKSCNCEKRCDFHHESFTETCIFGEGEEKKEISIFVKKIENNFLFNIKTIISNKFTDKIISKNEELYSAYELNNFLNENISDISGSFSKNFFENYKNNLY
jgi:hypothetical protein